jgi:hypothetical protein
LIAAQFRNQTTLCGSFSTADRNFSCTKAVILLRAYGSISPMGLAGSLGMAFLVQRTRCVIRGSRA